MERLAAPVNSPWEMATKPPQEEFARCPIASQDGQQPEALRSLKSAAKAGSRKPQEQGLEARGDTAPIPAPLEQEQDAAAKVLKEGVEKNPQGMEDAARKAPKR